MDIEKNYSCLEQNCKVYQKSIDVDEDYQETLAGYCDDIYRVVKCESHSYIVSIDTNFNEIKIFGKTEICLTYYNENSNLCYADFEEEFTKLIDIEEISENAFANATVNNKYTNFRVINQRRIDFHNALSLNVSVYDKVKSPCITSCENSKLKVEKLKTASIISTSISKVEFDEEFTTSAESSSIKRIISSSSFVTLGETKIIKDKALIKAKVTLSVLYTNDDEEETISKCEYSFNISKIIDASGVNDGDYIIANLTIGNIFFKAKSSSNDKLCVIQAYGDISVNAIFIHESEQDIVTDGYVLNYKCDNTFSDFNSCKNGRYLADTKMLNLTFDLSAEIKEIKELNITLSDPYARNNKILSKATANAMCVTGDGGLSSFSNTSDIEIDIENCQNAIASLSIQSYDYTISAGGRIEVRLSCVMSSYIFEESKIKILSDITVGEKFETEVLTIYFGKKNESIWEVAKKLSSDIDLIISENSLSSDILENDKVLIIPGV
jgi:hypothetical protein